MLFRSDVEFVAQHLKTLPSTARVALCDLSPELLAQAKLRVDALGLASRVDLIQCDITAGPKALAELGLKQGDSAVVTCSYCLTMIPQWKAAVDAMLGLLVKDGALCLIDFTQRFDSAHTLMERVYKAWFGLDGVYFNREQVDYVAARTAPEYYSEARSRVPYTPWYPTRCLPRSPRAPMTRSHWLSSPSCTGGARLSSRRRRRTPRRPLLTRPRVGGSRGRPKSVGATR